MTEACCEAVNMGVISTVQLLPEASGVTEVAEGRLYTHTACQLPAKHEYAPSTAGPAAARSLTDRW